MPFGTRPLRRLALLVAPLLLVAAASAQIGPPYPVHVTPAGPEQPVPAGGLFPVVLELVVDAPYHIYAYDHVATGIPTALAGPESGPFELESTVHPDNPKIVTDPILGETYHALEGAFTIRAFFRSAPDTPPGDHELPMVLTYQACDDRGCLFPKDETISVPVSVRAAKPGEDLDAAAAALGTMTPRGTGGGTGGADGQALVTLEAQFDQALASGEIGTFLWLSLVLAFVSLLTPCVFPMIPITVSFFSKRAEASGGGRGVSYALAYGAGIVATYSGLGVGMAAALGASSLQTLATNPWTNLAIGGIFVFFGLSLLGLYELRPPRFLTRRADGAAAAKGSGYLPVFVMGFVFTVTAFTCTAPIVGSLLPALSTSGSPSLIVLGMLVYSTAFALPFVLLAMFPGAVSRLPGAGGWMNTLKVVLGFLELAAALKFLSATDLVWDLQLLTRPVMLTATVFLGLALALYLFGAYRLPNDSAPVRRWISGRTLTAVLALFAVLYLAAGMQGRALDSWTESFLPPYGYGDPGGGLASDGIAWVPDYDEARAEGARAGKNLFVDFTGVTCQNCRKVEKQFFHDPAFQAAMAGVVPTQLYTDRLSPEYKAGDARNRALMEEFGSVTLPLYLLIDPDGTELRRMGYSPDFSLDDFLQFLEDPRS